MSFSLNILRPDSSDSIPRDGYYPAHKKSKNYVENEDTDVTAKDQDHRCKAKTKSGKPCGAAATAGGLCFFHANPNKASELGRIGGRSNRHAAGEQFDPLPALDNALAVRDTIARLIVDVYAGEIHPRIAAGLAPLLSLQLRAIETTDLQRRLAEVEKQLNDILVQHSPSNGRGATGVAKGQNVS